MNISDFDYELPESFIAQSPIEPRDASRLLVLHRDTGKVEHRIFREVGEYLREGDVLVLNQTRVIPARIFAKKSTGGKAELLLLRRRDASTWECLVGGKGLRVGSLMRIVAGLEAKVLQELNGSERLVQFTQPIEPYLEKVGHVPLPPYIKQTLSDPERYQTVYATQSGSAAAPTAGLHFTQRLLKKLQDNGVKPAYATLHVGLDTFAPVTEVDPRQHKIHTEWCELPEMTADTINHSVENAGRVIAVGTTSVRVLETAAMQNERRVSPYAGSTNLFILPGYRFKIVDALITNFHLPRSSLLMLVSAFAGREKILETYQTARQEKYRFYSFGDAMLIL